VLGDSLVWSGETRSGALYTEVLEDELATVSSPVEVVNAGVPGYTTWQELEFLERYGLDMEPDLVVLAFVLNDLFPTYLHRPTKESLLAIDPAAHRLRLDPDGLAGRIVSRSYLAHEIVKRIRSLARRLAGREGFSFERRLDFYLAWEEWPWRRVGHLLRRMASLLAAREARLAVVAFPFIDQVDAACVARDPAYVLGPQRRLGALCREAGWPFLDLAPALREGGGRRLFVDEVHLNGRGNEIVPEPSGPKPLSTDTGDAPRRRPSHVVGLTGSPGAGKSTLVAAMASEAVVTRASWLRRKWTRFVGALEFYELYDVGFE